jgi:molybdenum cofactor guanylyltransferase
MAGVENGGSTVLAEVGSTDFGAIILCGGRSTRMGRDKASLPLGPGETMLWRVVRLVGEVVPLERIVCAAAPEQSLPSLPAGVRTVFDRQTDCGPLAGLAAGLKAVQDDARAAFVTGCDVPLLAPAFVRRMFALLADFQIAAPHDGARFHPLAAVYRIDVLPAVEAQLATADRSLAALLGACRTRPVPVDELRDVDPELASLAGCNTPEEYRHALQRSHLHPMPKNQELKSNHG